MGHMTEKLVDKEDSNPAKSLSLRKILVTRKLYDKEETGDVEDSDEK